MASTVQMASTVSTGLQSTQSAYQAGVDLLTVLRRVENVTRSLPEAEFVQLLAQPPLQPVRSLWALVWCDCGPWWATDPVRSQLIASLATHVKQLSNWVDQVSAALSQPSDRSPLSGLALVQAAVQVDSLAAAIRQTRIKNRLLEQEIGCESVDAPFESSLQVATALWVLWVCCGLYYELCGGLCDGCAVGFAMDLLWAVLWVCCGPCSQGLCRGYAVPWVLCRGLCYVCAVPCVVSSPVD